MTTTRPLVYVAAKHSQYQKHVVDRPDPRALRLLRDRDLVVARWRRADTLHRRTHERVLTLLHKLGAEVVTVRRPHAPFDPRRATLVVTVGGDGTLLAASHHVGGQPVLGVNSSPEHSVGNFCAARPDNLQMMLEEALDGSLPVMRLLRMRVVQNGQLRSARVLNEALFTHRIPAAVSRYILFDELGMEEQRSSGLWIGTAAGSTGALRSAGGLVLPLGSRKLEYVVREPYTPPTVRSRIRRRGFVAFGDSLTVKSKIDEAVVFLDGPYRRIKVHLGDVLEFSASDEPLGVLGIRRSRFGSHGS